MEAAEMVRNWMMPQKQYGMERAATRPFRYPEMVGVNGDPNIGMNIHGVFDQDRPNMIGLQAKTLDGLLSGNPSFNQSQTLGHELAHYMGDKGFAPSALLSEIGDSDQIRRQRKMDGIYPYGTDAPAYERVADVMGYNYANVAQAQREDDYRYQQAPMVKPR